MADTIAVMNEGRIEQAGSAADLYERPRTEFVANFLGVSNLVDAKLTSTRGRARRRSRPTTARGCALPADRIGPHGADAVRVGVRPEKITLVPAGQDCPRGANVLRGTVVVAAFLGVSIQYLIRAAGGEELTVIAQNADGAEPEALGAGREVQLAWSRSTPSSSPRRPRMPNDPRLERALEEFFTSERLSRRAVHRPRRLDRAWRSAASRPCSPPAAASRAPRRRARRRREEGRRGQPPQDRDRQLDVLELAALHRQEGHQGLQQGVRRQVQVRRGDQRQLRVLREDPPAARAGHADRPRHHHADRLPGRAPRAPQLRRADRQEERPERGEPGRQPQVDQLRPQAQLLDAVAVGRDRPGLQHQEDRARAQRASRTSSTRSSRAA